MASRGAIRTMPEPMRNALLATQGRRLGQVGAVLARRLPPEAVLALFRQALAAPFEQFWPAGRPWQVAEGEKIEA